MASNQVDVPRDDILKHVYLILLKNRLKTKERKVLEPSQVRFLILTCPYMGANYGTFTFITFYSRCNF